MQFNVTPTGDFTPESNSYGCHVDVIKSNRFHFHHRFDVKAENDNKRKLFRSNDSHTGSGFN